MKRLLTLSVITIAVAALCVPAAAWEQNWATDFEQPTYAVGPLVGQDGWTLLSGASPNIVTPFAQSGVQSAEQAVGASMAGKNLTGLSGGLVYYMGYAKFWLYDPGDPAGTTTDTDGRVGIQSSVGGSSVSTVFSANVTTSRSTTYWFAQWSWSPVQVDGVTGPTGAGYTFTPGVPAFRSVGWNYVYLNWVFNYNVGLDPNSGGTGHIEWRINQTAAPSLTLDFDSTSGRWANSHEIAGVTQHSPYGCVTQSYVDNIEFHADAVPEPSSLLALGAGLVGLVGVIRRRR